MAAPKRQVLVKKRLFTSTIVIYIAIATIVVSLIITNTIPIVSGLIGCALGMALFGVIAKDLYPRED